MLASTTVVFWYESVAFFEHTTSVGHVKLLLLAAKLIFSASQDLYRMGSAEEQTHQPNHRPHQVVRA